VFGPRKADQATEGRRIFRRPFGSTFVLSDALTDDVYSILSHNYRNAAGALS
jgi:hypothetical protein